MRRYKLLKDTPTLKAGTIFEEVVSDFDGLKALARITPVGAKTSPQFTINDIDNFNDWFEEIPKEYKRWRAKVSYKYWYVDNCGRVDYYCEYRDKEDDNSYAIGNYFKTEAMAEAYKEYLFARQILLDDAEGGKFIPGKQNHFAHYDIDDGWHLNWSYYYNPGGIYFKEYDSLQKSLEEHKEQWEIVRKYEMGEL